MSLAKKVTCGNFLFNKTIKCDPSIAAKMFKRKKELARQICFVPPLTLIEKQKKPDKALRNFEFQKWQSIIRLIKIQYRSNLQTSV